jgi:prolyl-tRNA editing enzyme YbaK/EbsC (Cys-tRNA(Pro) deacylase)
LTENTLPESVQRVAQALRQHGHLHAPLMLSSAARTAQQAADALAVQLGQIAKSIIFCNKTTGRAVLVITSGDKRVDEAKVAALLGEPLQRANADFVREQTGYAIGGVPPLAHAQSGHVLIDRELLRFETIWAAAGHPHAVFQLRPQDLQRFTQAPLVDVVQTEVVQD